MNEDSCKCIPSEQENQSNELKEEQLNETTGGLNDGVLVSKYNRRCAADPAHRYFASFPDDVCPYCGAKEYVEW